MNQLTLLVVVLVAFCYFGGKYCPSALKKNKEMLLGVAGGLVLCSFFGLRLEGFQCQFDSAEHVKSGRPCNAEGHDYENTLARVAACRKGIAYDFGLEDEDIPGHPCLDACNSDPRRPCAKEQAARFAQAKAIDSVATGTQQLTQAELDAATENVGFMHGTTHEGVVRGHANTDAGYDPAATTRREIGYLHRMACQRVDCTSAVPDPGTRAADLYLRCCGE